MFLTALFILAILRIGYNLFFKHTEPGDPYTAIFFAEDEQIEISVKAFTPAEAIMLAKERAPDGAHLMSIEKR